MRCDHWSLERRCKSPATDWLVDGDDARRAVYCRRHVLRLTAEINTANAALDEPERWSLRPLTEAERGLP